MGALNLVISREFGRINTKKYLKFIISNIGLMMKDRQVCPKKRSILNMLRDDLKLFFDYKRDKFGFYERAVTSFNKEILEFIFSRLGSGCEFYIIGDEALVDSIELIKSDFKFGYDIVKLG